jgi:hypothetical protein
MDLSVPPSLGGANPPLSETSPRTIAVGLGHREAFEQQYPYHWMVKNLEECKRLHLEYNLRSLLAARELALMHDFTTDSSHLRCSFG